MEQVVVEIDQVELAVRIAEVCCKMKRPAGQSAKEAITAIRATHPEAAADFIRCAEVAMEYIAEKMRDQNLTARAYRVQPTAGGVQCPRARRAGDARKTVNMFHYLRDIPAKRYYSVVSRETASRLITWTFPRNIRQPRGGFPSLPQPETRIGAGVMKKKKKNLSFPPESPYVKPNENYFKVPHEALRRTGITGFHERTISRTSGLAKDQARWRIVNTFLRTCPTHEHMPEAHLLTTPGAWWHFERLLTGRLEHAEQKARFVSFEKDPKLFRLSAVFMATVFHKITKPEKRGGVDCVSIGKQDRAVLFNCDVFDYLARTAARKAKFSGVWLDLTSTISSGLTERLKLLEPRLNQEYCMLAITLIRGREQGGIRDTLAAGKKRKRVLEDIVRDTCGDDFRIADLFDYSDSSPMQQVIFLRGATPGGGRYIPGVTQGFIKKERKPRGPATVAKPTVCWLCFAPVPNVKARRTHCFPEMRAAMGAMADRKARGVA